MAYEAEIKFQKRRIGYSHFETVETHDVEGIDTYDSQFNTFQFINFSCETA